jgi:hypothetical protein
MHRRSLAIPVYAISTRSEPVSAGWSLAIGSESLLPLDITSVDKESRPNVVKETWSVLSELRHACKQIRDTRHLVLTVQRLLHNAGFYSPSRLS